MELHIYMNEEKPYLNREVKDMFDDLQKGQDRIEAQVKLTNGRVGALERWKYIGMGATGVLTTIIVPILAWALWEIVNIPQTVHSAVEQSLSAYNIHQ